MPALSSDEIQSYLSRLLGRAVRVISLSEQGRKNLAGTLKGFGYGTPVFIDFETDGEKRTAVLETMSPSSFGHEHFSDRAQAVLWEHETFNRLPRHVRSLDSGAFLRSGSLISTGQAEEFFLLTEFAEGQGYFLDLDRISKTGTAAEADFARVSALSEYLAGIHAVKRSTPSLYIRRIRELIGHGECIMGLIDNYPDNRAFPGRDILRSIELKSVEWRWRLKSRVHRLSQVHGDFHPWNILFRTGTDFTVLDRSRGEWGEPADDVACMTINYIFSSLIRYARLGGPFEKMFFSFWDDYLARTQDREILETAAPFYAWRGLVIGSPVWYPHLPDGVRETIFRFIDNVLADGAFDYAAVNRYLQ